MTIDYSYDPLQRLVAADYSTGEFFHYSYDSVGNRLTQDTQVGTNTYDYDIANRLIEVDGVEYTWDDNGNLLDDGLRQYVYDRANRLTTVEIDYDDYEFAYNGLGDRLAQEVNGEPTLYTLDVATGLTQVLSDGNNAYLYGVARIGEQQPDGWQYHMGDGLNSLRQLADGLPSTTLAMSYQPFGAVHLRSGITTSVFQFAGEHSHESGLIFLRARYYSSSEGRFLNRDAWIGSPYQPMSYNRWLYAWSNPLNRTDPSGHAPPEPSDHRNLTDWLVREMRANAVRPEVIKIARNNEIAADLWELPFAQTYSLVFKGFAYDDWYGLVHDGARWDFKDSIDREFPPDQTIALCHTSGCGWYEYSVPGNIHYGYVGRAAGFNMNELHLGASVAEVTDEAHRRQIEILGPWFVNLARLGQCLGLELDIYINFAWYGTWFDDPTDFAAVSAGTDLWDIGAYPSNVDQMTSVLARYSSSLAKMPDPGISFFHERWPFPVGFFDGGG